MMMNLCALASLEHRSTLCKEGRCSFPLVFGPRANCEQRRFKEQAFREAHIQSLVYRLNGVLHADWSVGDELVEYRFRSCEQTGGWNDFIHQADAIGFRRADDFARKNQ